MEYVACLVKRHGTASVSSIYIGSDPTSLWTVDCCQLWIITLQQGEIVLDFSLWTVDYYITMHLDNYLVLVHNKPFHSF